jgi:hypothetical protein
MVCASPERDWQQLWTAAIAALEFPVAVQEVVDLLSEKRCWNRRLSAACWPGKIHTYTGIDMTLLC